LGKFILYGLLVIGASSLTNWTTLGRSAGSNYYGGYGTRGGWIGAPGGGFSSSGSGHK
jgi:hypothetical protein